MWWTHLRLAVRSLGQHAFRSSLTVVSIAVGCFGVVAMTSLAESGLTSLARSIEELGGARLLFFVTQAPEREKERAASYETGLDRDDFERVFADLPIESRSMQAMLGEREALADSGKRSLTDLVAADPGFFQLFQMKVAEGRSFDASDEARRQPVCVVGHVLARKLWQGSPIGRWLQLEKLQCRVIGLFANNERFGVRFGFDWTNLVVVPHSTLSALMPEVRAETSILLKTRSAEDNDSIKRIANARLEARHHGVDDFTIYDFGRTMQRFEHTFRILELMVALVSGIALLIGGVGIMNMMLVSVAERVREIGLKKALGARRSDISGQFATEAALFGMAGGALGVLAGSAVALLSGHLITSALPSWVGVVSREAALGSFVCAVFCALFFGWLPARKAGRLDPVEALRR